MLFQSFVLCDVYDTFNYHYNITTLTLLLCSNVSATS